MEDIQNNLNDKQIELKFITKIRKLNPSTIGISIRKSDIMNTGCEETDLCQGDKVEVIIRKKVN